MGGKDQEEFSFTCKNLVEYGIPSCLILKEEKTELVLTLLSFFVVK